MQIEVKEVSIKKHWIDGEFIISVKFDRSNKTSATIGGDLVGHKFSGFDESLMSAIGDLVESAYEVGMIDGISEAADAPEKLGLVKKEG